MYQYCFSEYKRLVYQALVSAGTRFAPNLDRLDDLAVTSAEHGTRRVE